MTISDFSTVSPPLFLATGLRRRSLCYFYKLVRRPAYSPACVNRSGLLEVARAIWNARTTLSQGLSTASSCLLNKKFVSQTIGANILIISFFSSPLAQIRRAGNKWGENKCAEATTGKRLAVRPLATESDWGSRLKSELWKEWCHIGVDRNGRGRRGRDWRGWAPADRLDDYKPSCFMFFNNFELKILQIKGERWKIAHLLFAQSSSSYSYKSAGDYDNCDLSSALCMLRVVPLNQRLWWKLFTKDSLVLTTL